MKYKNFLLSSAIAIYTLGCHGSYVKLLQKTLLLSNTNYAKTYSQLKATKELIMYHNQLCIVSTVALTTCAIYTVALVHFSKTGLWSAYFEYLESTGIDYKNLRFATMASHMHILMFVYYTAQCINVCKKFLMHYA